MKRLTELGKKYGTDKATHHTFTDIYDSYFAKFKNPNILEIGVDKGASLKMYNDYYGGFCNIVGLDLRDLYRGNEKNIKTIIGNQARITDLKKCVDELNGFDIILDDGSHYMKDQQKSLCYLFDYLRDKGIYILEDLHTSFIESFNPQKTLTTINLLVQLGEGKYSSYSQYVSQKDFLRLKKQIKNVNIFGIMNKKSLGKSMTSIIEKI